MVLKSNHTSFLSKCRFSLLSELNADFVYAVETFGKIIIAEKEAPIAMKTIKPTSLGGVAGGEKFVHQVTQFSLHCIYYSREFFSNTQRMFLFKKKETNNSGCTEAMKQITMYYFDLFYIYLQFAMKAAGNELRAVTRFFQVSYARAKILCTPLLATCDFHGC